MIELNVPYTGAQLATELFKVKPKTFSNKRKQYLNYLSQFYEFEEQGKKIILKKQLKPFQTRKEAKKNTVENNLLVYKDLTHKIIAEKPLNSGSNIAREIFFSPIKPFDHSTGTIENYVRPTLKEDFEVQSRTWSRINYGENVYEPLTNEEKTYLLNLFRSSDLNEHMMDLTADYKCGNISREEYQQVISGIVESKYDRVMSLFKVRFGFRPYKVPKWRVKMIEQKGNVLCLN